MSGTALAVGGSRNRRLAPHRPLIATPNSWAMVYQAAGEPEAAEDAYRKSLAIEVRLGNAAGQAGRLSQLGLLHDEVLGRTEEAVAFLRQAADKDVEGGDPANEGKSRNDLAATPDWDFSMAAEILFLIETLENPH